VLLPVTVLRHYYPSPKYLLFVDAILVRHDATPATVLAALRDYSRGWPAIARGVLRHLQSKYDPDVAEKATIAAVNVAYNYVKSSVCSGRIAAVFGDIPGKAVDIVRELARLPPEEVIARWEELECETRVAPWTLHEYLSSPAAKKVVPPEYIQLPRRHRVQQAQQQGQVAAQQPSQQAQAQQGTAQQPAQQGQQPIPMTATQMAITQQMCRLAQAVTQYISSGSGSVNAYSAQQQLLESLKAALEQYQQLERRMLDAVEQRLAVNVDEERQRGSRSRGLTGTAGLMLDGIRPTDGDAVLDIGEYLARVIGDGVVDHLRKTLPRATWLRRDRRIDSAYLPGPAPAVSKRPVAIIGIDVSGSVSAAELRSFVKTLGEILLPRVDPEESRVVYWSTRVERIVPLREEVKNPRPPSGGGTDPRPFFTYAQDYIARKRRRAAVVLLSDGWWGSEDEYQAAEDTAKKAAVAVAGITDREATAEELRRRGWQVRYVPVKSL